MCESQDPFSVHHFLFPFRWDVLPNRFSETDVKENLDFDRRTCMETFNKMLCDEPDCLWVHRQYRKENDGEFDTNSYNEFTYFHEFVRNAIYDYETTYSKSIMRYYEFKVDKSLDNSYKINWKERERKKGNLTDQIYAGEYSLQLNGISLHVFNTGIGLLTFNLTNNTKSDPNDIKKINEFGRRIYPQFVGCDGVLNTKDAFLADKIILQIGGQPEIEEDFSGYLTQISVQKPFQPPAYIERLFPKSFCFEIGTTLKSEKILISRVMDDRMFFISWIGNRRLSNLLSTETYKTYDWWYSYMFGDKGWKSIANDEMQIDHVKRHTYGRWLNYGTLFGITRDSFVSVSDTPENLVKNGAPRLNDHMNTMYYQMVVLCLAQRASILKFSAEVANLAEIKIKGNRDLLERLKALHRNYLEFTNKIYFREVTSQIQGIELYEQMQKIMNIPNDVADLDKEIGALFSYVRLEEEEKQSKAANSLQLIGFPLLTMSVISGILGTNIWKPENFQLNEPWRKNFMSEAFLWWVILCIIVPGLISYLAIYIYQRRSNKRI